jgi:SH3 domain-containing protein
MTFTHRLSLLALLMTCAAPAMADDWALKIEERHGDRKNEIRKGRADLRIEGEPNLTLKEDGAEAVAMPGIEVFGGYLFAESREAIAAIMPKSGGMIAAIKSVSEIQQATTVVPGLRVRSLPTTEGSQIVANLRGGQRVEVLEVKDGWAKVKVDYSKEGWAKISGSRTYLELSTVPKLTSIQGARSIFLSKRGPGWQGQVKEGASWQGDIVLRNNTHAAPTTKRVLVIADRRHSGDGGAFNVYAKRIRKTYGEQGYQTVIADVDSFEDVIDELKAATSAPYSRMMIIGHGGWDGPVLHSHVGTRQVSGKYNEELYAEFVEAVKAGMTRDGKILNSSCHAAGTARDEKVSYGSPYNWVHDLAHRTGLQVAGPAGKTSTEWTLQHALAALEGRGVTTQEVHVARGDKLRILWPGMNLRSATTIDLPEIKDLPQPKTEEAPEAGEAQPEPAPAITNGRIEGTVSEPEALPSATVDLAERLSEGLLEAGGRAIESLLRNDESGQPSIGRPLGGNR